jgi:hypothetical protein
VIKTDVIMVVPSLMLYIGRNYFKLHPTSESKYGIVFQAPVDRKNQKIHSTAMRYDSPRHVLLPKTFAPLET